MDFDIADIEARVAGRGKAAHLQSVGCGSGCVWPSIGVAGGGGRLVTKAGCFVGVSASGHQQDVGEAAGSGGGRGYGSVAEMDRVKAATKDERPGWNGGPVLSKLTER